MGGKTPESLMNRLELNEIDAMGLMEAQANAKAEQLKDMMLDEVVQTKELPHRGYPHTFAHPGLKFLVFLNYKSNDLKNILQQDQEETKL